MDNNAATTLPNPPAVRTRDDGIADGNGNGGRHGGGAVAVRSGIAGLIPQTLDDVYRLAQAISKSGLAPKDLRTPEAITVAIMTGLELGLPPMFALNKIAVINGRPTLWGDAIPALLWSRGFKLREWEDDTTSYCEVTRPDGQIITRTFSDADAKAAGLLGKSGPWSQFKKRMRQMRARAFACRDGAADVLGGLYVAEEIDGGPLQAEGTMSSAFERKSSAEGKRDGSVKKFNAILVSIKDAASIDELRALKMDHMNSDGIAWHDMPRAWADTIEQDYQVRELDLGVEEGDEVAP